MNDSMEIQTRDFDEEAKNLSEKRDEIEVIIDRIREELREKENELV